MINFDALPSTVEKKNALIPKGQYKGTVEKAEMRLPKDDSKPPYLNITWNITDINGKNLGKLFDIFSESEKPLLQHKLKMFIIALGINLGKTFELRDLTKVSVGKSCLLDITIDESNKDNPRNQINIFSDNCYTADPDNADIPFNKESASDSNSAESY